MASNYHVPTQTSYQCYFVFSSILLRDNIQCSFTYEPSKWGVAYEVAFFNSGPTLRKLVPPLSLCRSDCMKLLNFNDIQSTYCTKIRNYNGIVGRGDRRTQFINHTILRPEPYIVNFPLSFRDCHSHIPRLLQKVP